MDFSQLSAVSGITHRLSQSRADTAQKLCEQGFTLLAALLKGVNRQDLKKHFMEAFDIFSKALGAQRSHPEPYIGLAYLLALVEDYPRAMAYTKAAQRLAPQHEDIDVLLAYLIAKTSAKAKSKPLVQELHPSSPEIDYDALYDKVELRLKMELRRIKQTPIENPSGEMEQLSSQRTLMQNLNVFQDEIQQQLKILDQEFDISDLSSDMRQITQYSQTLRQSLAISEGLALLAQQIESEELYLEQFSAQIEILSHEELEQAFEKVLDRCDRLADQLDHWEAKGLNMETLIKRYERLTREVETIQDQFDERRDLVIA